MSNSIIDLVYSKASFQPTRWGARHSSGFTHSRYQRSEREKIATELVHYTQRYFDERGIRVDVEFSWGATEARPLNGLVDAIVEVTESGSTIRAPRAQNHP